MNFALKPNFKSIFGRKHKMVLIISSDFCYTFESGATVKTPLLQLAPGWPKLPRLVLTGLTT